MKWKVNSLLTCSEMKKKFLADVVLKIVQYLTVLCGTLWKVLKNWLFQWGHVKIPVNFNVKVHIKKIVSSCFPYMLYTIGEATTKTRSNISDEAFPKKKVNSFRSIDVWMGSECPFGWRTKRVLFNLIKSYDPVKLEKRIRKQFFVEITETRKSPNENKTAGMMTQIGDTVN